MKIFRFVFCPAIGMNQPSFFGHSVESQELAELHLNIIADYTLYLHDKKVMNDYPTFGHIECRDSDSSEWHEIDVL